MTITLSDLDAPTFGENAVNGAPQLIDGDVTVTASGGECLWIAVRGLLPEDRVGILSGSLLAALIGYAVTAFFSRGRLARP